MSEPIGVFSTVMIGVDDMEAAVGFYRDVMGFRLKFRDGDRWAAFDTGTITLALAARSESGGERTAFNIKVPDVTAALTRAVRGGAIVINPRCETDHEVRAAVRDPAGQLIHFYRTIKQPA